MMYPRKTPKQAQEDAAAKKLISQQQRDQLKALMSQKLQAKYPTKDSEGLLGKVENFFAAQQPLTAENLKELDRQVAHSVKSVNPVNLDRDDLSVKSGVSKMSGATDFLSEKLSETGRKTHGTIDLMPRTRKADGTKYKNEEEEWADIYKYNLGVYKAEAELEQDRREHAKRKYKSELDEQVHEKNHRKQEEKDWVQVDYEQVLKKVHKEEMKEKKKNDIAKAKIHFEKAMRDKQIKEIRAQRKQEIKEEKELDRQMIQRIREEQKEEERQARKRKEDDYAYYRKVLLDNEEKRKILNEELAKEKREETRQIEELNRLVEERERARDEEAKAKDRRIRGILENAKGLVGKPKDDREKRQDMKVQKWADKKLQEDLQAEHQEKVDAWQKKMDSRAYYDQQIKEKNERKAAEKIDYDSQAKVWQDSTEKYKDWEKAREDAKKKQMKDYAEVLKKQMEEKFEERRIYDRLFDLRATQNEKKQLAA